jgi:hypothetical protein
MVEIIKSTAGRRASNHAFGFRMLVDQGKCGVNAPFAADAAASGRYAIGGTLF